MKLSLSHFRTGQFQLQEQLGCGFEIQTTGDERWVRVFVADQTPPGCSLGRINFFKEEFNNLKNYKRMYISDISQSDCIMFRLEKFLTSGVLISQAIYNRLHVQAVLKVKDDYEDKVAWRLANPTKKKRKALQGRNPRHMLWEAIRVYTPEATR